MKYFVTILITLSSFQSYCQNIYSVEYSNQSDVKVFVVEYESQCDLKVFKVEYNSQAKGNEGLWYFVKYSSQADKKIFPKLIISRTQTANNCKFILLKQLK